MPKGLKNLKMFPLFGPLSKSMACFGLISMKTLKAAMRGPHTCLDMVTVTMNHYRNSSCSGSKTILGRSLPNHILIG